MVYRQALAQEPTQFSLSIDREGLHAVVGAMFGLMPFLAYWWGDSMLLRRRASVAQALGVVLFLAYEITEGMADQGLGLP